MASSSSVSLLIVALVIVVLGTTGVALIAVGLRGRRIHDRPVCARCRFDVTGLVARSREASAGPMRCPECGTDLARAGGVRQGFRQRRRVPLAFGILLLLMIVSVGVLAMTARVSHAGVAARLPTSALVGLSRFGADDAYLIELAARVTAGETSPVENASLAARVLTRMGDAKQGWSSGWDALLASLHDATAIANDDVNAAYRSSVTATLRTRDRVRATGSTTYHADIVQPRWAVPTMATVGVGAMSVEFRDDKGNIAATAVQHGYSLQSGRRLSSGAMGARVRVPDLAPGSYVMDLTVMLVAGIGKERSDYTFPIEIPLRLTKPIEVVAADQPLVKVLESPEHEKQIRDAIWSMTAEVSRGFTPPHLQLSVSFKGLPVGVAYRVFAIPSGANDNQRFELGTLAIEANANPNHVRGYAVSGEMPRSFDASVIDVIFEPDPMVAETNVELREIANATVRVEGVKVDWGNQRPTTP